MGRSKFDPDAFTRESRGNWDQASRSYEALSSRLFGPMTRKFIRFSGVQTGQRVLDVACGPGTASLPAARAVGPKGRVLGVDLSPAMTRLAAARSRRAGLGRARFKVMDAQELPLPPRSFDAAICQLGLMLFARPDRALARMRRVCRPGATVTALVQGRARRMVFTSLPLMTVLRHAPELRVPGAPTLYSFGAPGVLAEAFRQAGLARVRVRRLAGAFAFRSEREYWRGIALGGGRLRSFLASLPTEKRAAIETEVLARARAYRRGGALKIPFEMVMARGRVA